MPNKILKFFSVKITIEIIFLVLSVAMGIYFQWEIMNLLFLLILLRLIIHPIPSRFPAGMAVTFLVFTAILLVFKRDNWAENTAIFAYYFLILTVSMGIFEIRQEKSAE